MEREHKIGFFDELVCRGAGVVRLLSGPEPRLLVVGDDELVDRVVVRYRGARLVVSFRTGPNPAMLFGRGASVTTIVVTDDIGRVAVQGAANLQFGDGAENPFASDSLRLVSSGTGAIEGHVSVTEISVRLRGISGARLAGDAAKLDVRLAGTGSLDATELVARNAKVVVSSTGNCRLMVLDTLAATMNGTGSLTYRGSASLTRRGAGVGRVEHLE